MKRLFILTTLVLFALVSTQAQTLDKVLDKHFEATGHKKMAALKTFSQKAKMSMMGMEMPMNIQFKKPNKFRVEMEMMGQKTVSAFDGEKGWMINPMMGSAVQDLEGDQLKQSMSQADMEGELFNYAEKGHSAELIGKVNADGKEAYKIKLTTKDGTEQTYFIDANSYLVLKMKTKAEAMGQAVEIETNMVEYKEIEGIMVPMKIEMVMPMGKSTMIMEEVKFNIDIDDSVFARPAN